MSSRPHLWVRAIVLLSHNSGSSSPSGRLTFVYDLDNVNSFLGQRLLVMIYRCALHMLHDYFSSPIYLVVV